MALKIYKWRGHTYQIEESQVHLYPGAEPVKSPKEKKKTNPANKSRQTEDK